MFAVDVSRNRIAVMASGELSPLNSPVSLPSHALPNLAYDA